MKGSVWVALFVACFSPIALQAQEKGVDDLDLDELAAVDLEKSCLPTVVDTAVVFAENTINIGCILPFSKFPEVAKEFDNAAQLAVREVNEAGILSGRQLHVISTDDAGEEDFTLLKAQELLGKYHVKGFIGPTGSSRFIALYEKLLQKHPAVCISPSATSLEISELDDKGLGFRTAASDALQGKTAAIYAAKNLKKKTAAIFYIDNVHGQGLAKVFETNFKALGGQITGTAHYSPLVNLDSYNVTDKLAGILSSRPDVLYFATNNENLINISRQIAEKELFNDYKPILIASEATRGNIVLEKAALDVLEGMYGTSVTKNHNTEFAKKYEREYGGIPSLVETADVYDIVFLFALALAKSEANDPEHLAKTLITISSGGEKVTANDLALIRQYLSEGTDMDYEGVNSSLNFDINGEIPDRHYQIWQLIDGRFKDHIAEVRLK